MQNQEFIIAKEGFPWIISGLVMMIVSLLFGWIWVFFLFLLLVIFFGFFFRNPRRTPPREKGLVLSPADGIICMVTEYPENQFLHEKRRRISIFMSPFNCHINRSPISGKVIKIFYNPGKFHLARVDKASELNEQNKLLIEDENKNQWVVIQIAGFFARRIVSRVKPGDYLTAGERFGLIQFGSRVDLYIPSQVKLVVKVGDIVKGGETILGRI